MSADVAAGPAARAARSGSSPPPPRGLPAYDFFRFEERPRSAESGGLQSLSFSHREKDEARLCNPPVGGVRPVPTVAEKAPVRHGIARLIY